MRSNDPHLPGNASLSRKDDLIVGVFNELTAVQVRVYKADSGEFRFRVTGNRKLDKQSAFTFKSGPGTISFELQIPAVLEIYRTLLNGNTDFSFMDDREGKDTHTALILEQHHYRLSIRAASNQLEVKMDEANQLEVLHACFTFLRGRMRNVDSRTLQEWIVRNDKPSTESTNVSRAESVAPQTNNEPKNPSKALWAIYYNRWPESERCGKTIDYILNNASEVQIQSLILLANKDDFKALNHWKAQYQQHSKSH